MKAMKTTKIYALLTFAVIFAAATASFGAAIGGITTDDVRTKGIHHHVNVILTGEISLCNTYLIEIRDGSGQLVAPAQTFKPGVSGYDFYERGPSSGIRVARLVRANNGKSYICDKELFTTPAYVLGPFLNGQTYRYDLFPSLQSNKE
jgi:hypothetical protein